MYSGYNTYVPQNHQATFLTHTKNTQAVIRKNCSPRDATIITTLQNIPSL